jgi:hypothetical protein
MRRRIWELNLHTLLRQYLNGDNLVFKVSINNRLMILLFQIVYFVCIIEIFCPRAAWSKNNSDNFDTEVVKAFGFLKFQMDTCIDNPPAFTGRNTEKIQSSFLDSACFIQSYAYLNCNFGSPEHAAYLYDQALVLLAFLARGLPDDLKRAEKIANAMVAAQENDRTFKDGRLRNAYVCGPPVDFSNGYTRLPGRWNNEKERFEEDEYAVGSDTGNLAWAAIALIQADKMLPPVSNGKYRQAAIRLANWIIAHTKVKDAWGGFYGGFAGGERAVGDPHGPQPLTWRSTEHNLDLVALFKLLEAEFGIKSQEGRYWRIQRNQALKFVDRMWDTDNTGRFLLTGLGPDGKKRNRSVIPLDAQTWGILALHDTRPTGSFEDVLNWVETNCRAKKIVHGYDFNCHDGDGAWWEGTAQMVVALKAVRRSLLPGKILGKLQSEQLQGEDYAGAMPAASKCGLTTGFYKLWISTGENLPWLYTDNPHVGATAWYIFALLGKNPFCLFKP